MDMKELIEKIVDQKLERFMTMKLSYCKLESLKPLTFAPEDNEKIKIKGSFLVVPKFRKFTEKDKNKKFVFASNADGQTYFYLYEPSFPQGSNGVSYEWKGEIKKCDLVGRTTSGEQVTITHGRVEQAVHEEGIE